MSHCANCADLELDMRAVREEWRQRLIDREEQLRGANAAHAKLLEALHAIDAELLSVVTTEGNPSIVERASAVRELLVAEREAHAKTMESAAALREANGTLSRSLRHALDQLPAEAAPEVLPETLPDGILDDAGWAHYGCRWNGPKQYYDFTVSTKRGYYDVRDGALPPDDIDWAHYRTLVASNAGRKAE